MSERQERCETCRFWEEGDSRGVGECHRLPPSLIEGQFVDRTDVVFPKEPRRRVFPETDNGDWCGEWQGKEDEQKETHPSDVADRDLRYRFILGGDQPEKARQKATLCERFLKLMREGYSSDEVRRIFGIRPRNKKLIEVLLVAEQIMNESRQEATNAKE